jgi:hypothetical protein
VETGFDEERSWKPLGITKQGEEQSQIALECPWSPVGEEGNRSPRRSHDRSKD